MGKNMLQKMYSNTSLLTVHETWGVDPGIQLLYRQDTFVKYHELSIRFDNTPCASMRCCKSSSPDRYEEVSKLSGEDRIKWLLLEGFYKSFVSEHFEDVLRLLGMSVSKEDRQRAFATKLSIALENGKQADERNRTNTN